jgi:hypothetical protein
MGKDSTDVPTTDIRFVKELYPRLKPSDEVIERYRDAIDQLPPITVATRSDGRRIIVDGYHRWQAHVREERETITVVDLGDLVDAQIIRESYRSNSTHGEQMSKAEKTHAAEHLYRSLPGTADERYADIAACLSVSVESAKKYASRAKSDETAEKKETAWDMWLDCIPQTQIAEKLGVDEKTVRRWKDIREQSSEMSAPPDSRQHFDVWQFQNAEKDAGQQSYFGALPPQVVENLLWFYTEPGQIIVDPFAGSGTTIEVAKRMGRRVWASDINGDQYAPYLPIHQANACDGWPQDAPQKAALVLLDPPYWKQAAGKYSDDASDLGNQKLDDFYTSWSSVVRSAVEHADRIAYIISPTELREGSAIDGKPVGVVDHATDMLAPFAACGWRVERRIIVPYQTQQATGQQVEWAREQRKMLKLYRDLVVMSR